MIQAKKKRTIGITVLALCAALAAGAFFMTHNYVDGTFFSKKERVYDLTKHEITPERYEQLRARYPDVQILWQASFQDRHYDPNVESLTVTTLTEEEARNLALLPALKAVDAADCRDYDALLLLAGARPDCLVDYRVPAGTGECGSLDTAYTWDSPRAEELRAALPKLPRLRDLTITGTLPEAQMLCSLREEFPELTLHYSICKWDRELSADAEEIDLSGTSVTAEELTELLPLLPRLTAVELSGTGIDAEAREQLAERYPRISFLGDVRLCGRTVSTGSRQIDLSGCPVTVEAIEGLLACCPRLEKLILTDCNLSNDILDGLNRQHPETAIVWTVDIGPIRLRTDASYFFPAKVDYYPTNEEMQALRYCTELLAVDIGHTRATDCKWLAYMPHLKYLILADTGIRDISPVANLKELIYLELFLLELDDYSPLLECTALQDLNLGETYADPTPIGQMTWLHNLQWHRAPWDPRTQEGALKLEEQLPTTNIQIYPSHNIGRPWRYLPNYYIFREIIGFNYKNQWDIENFYGEEDAARILETELAEPFAGDVLTQIFEERRIENDLPMPGVGRIGPEKEQVLYETLRASRSWAGLETGE